MMKLFRKILACFTSLIIIFCLFGVVLLWQGYRFYVQTPSKQAEERTFEVVAGSGLSRVADSLKEEGFIANAFWFKVYAKLSGNARVLQAGEFTLQEGMNYKSIGNTLLQGTTDEVSITIPEGYTIEQIGEVVRGSFDISEEEWDRVVAAGGPFEDHPFVVAARKPAALSLEGYLFPDTYRFFEDSTAEDIVGRMLLEMQENVEAANVRLSVYENGPTTLHEYLTLASILEREVRGERDMKIVSGIFYNRLEIGMALQMDSTVNYVTGKKTPGISLADTEIDSPYNTYMYAGLPPGPISNPGSQALNSLAMAEETDYFYFLTDAVGTVYYGVTHDQHVANKNAYLR